MTRTLAALLLFVSLSASAQPGCQNVDEYLRALEQLYAERLVFFGISISGRAILMLSVNRATGTWTIAVRDSNSPCVLPRWAGQGFIAPEEGWYAILPGAER